MNITSKPLSRIKILLPFLVFFLLLLNLTPIGEMAQNSFLSVSSPLISAFWSRGISTHQSIEGEYVDRLQLISTMVNMQRELEEMEDLRTALNLEMDNEFELLDSRIVGKAAENDQLIISRGENDGVLTGMPVVTASRSLVGEVVKTLPDFSFVKLISHPETGFEGKILGKEDSLGVVESDENIFLTMINRETKLEEGDIVITYPGGGLYPGGIFIGEVAEVIRDDAETFQSVRIDSELNPQNLAFLFIIIDF